MSKEKIKHTKTETNAETGQAESKVTTLNTTLTPEAAKIVSDELKLLGEKEAAKGLPDISAAVTDGTSDNSQGSDAVDALGAVNPE